MDNNYIEFEGINLNDLIKVGLLIDAYDNKHV